MQSLVYNQDFLEKNFNQSDEFKGVFTLGETQADTLTKIKTAKDKFDELTSKIENLTQTLEGVDGNGGKKAELVAVENKLTTKCWAQKQTHDLKFKGAFKGFRNDSVKFKEKVLQELTSNTSTLLPIAELEKKAESVFETAPTTEQSIPEFNATVLVAYEDEAILKKKVIGKEDVDIALMIKKLGNSDWVRQGKLYYESNNGICPFCQQTTSENFAKSLNEYFDETFGTDSKAIENLSSNYSIEASRLQNLLSSIIESPSRFLDIEKLKTEKELLDSKITINKQRISEKEKETSKVIELVALSNITSNISAIINEANNSVKEHNEIVANLSNEQKKLTSQVWRFIIEELKADLSEYRTDRSGIDKAIENITEQIIQAKTDKKEKEKQIKELEKLTTTIQPTIDGINSILGSFGFQGFSLSKTESGNSYKLVRADGSDAKKTLSEGEKSFVTFLYFFHLLKGSESESGITTDRVVVFDDPVSSLDSDILFIVSSLIKGLFDEVRAGTGYIKQVFVMTHNVYFHKEVTFNPNRHNVAMNEETFWIVRRPGLISKIEKHSTNPIKTSYELLWLEIKKTDRSNLSIQNTLRRILENYFKILGGVDPDIICSYFEGKEKMICKSLFSWINEGSHYAADDLYISIEDTMVEKYLTVFKSIFDKSGHISHYNMMMRNDFDDQPVE